jgi:hypothetical protein
VLIQCQESCEQCRKRKLKCDRNQPCKPCKKARHALLCTYVDEAGKPSSPISHRETVEAISEPAVTTPIVGNEQPGEKPRRTLRVTREDLWPPHVSTSNPTPRPYLQIAAEKTRMFGQGHWVHALEQVSTFNHNFKPIYNDLY